MTRSIPTRAALLGVVTAVAAMGASGMALARDGHREMPRFENLDADGDGRLTRVELRDAARDRFDEIDTDGDGRLTAAEIEAAAEQRRAARIARMVARLDTDGDGALSQDEFEARRGAGRMFERLDADSDGAISREEFAAAREMRRAHHEGHGRP